MSHPGTPRHDAANPAHAAHVHYPQREYPNREQITEVHDGIYWLNTPLPFRLRSINLWLLRDGHGWALVDCGYGREEVRDQWRALWRAHLGDRPVRQYVVTHYHPDHMGNSGWISEQWGITPQMSQSEWLFANLAVNGLGTDDIEQRCAFYRRNGLDHEREAVFRKGVHRYPDGCSIPAQYTRLRDGDEVRIDDRRWRVLVGYGHSPEHVCLYCEEIGVMISGDQILPQITPNVSVWPAEPDANPLKGFIDTMARFRTLLRADTLVLPSHRLPFTGVHARFDELEAHHHERLEACMQAVGTSGITAGELLDHLFSPDLDGHQIGFAMNEALAHLNYLMHEGRLERRAGGDGRIIFRRP